MDLTSFSKSMLKFRFGLKKRISLYERLDAYLEAGIDVVKSLTSIRDRYAKSKDFRAKILTFLIEDMGRGYKLEAAIKPWVPSNEHMLIAAGERGKGLSSGLKEATTMSMASARTKSVIIGGTMYPIVLTALLIGMLMIFQTKQAPVFVSLMQLELWPASAQTLYNISFFVTNYLWLVVAILVSLSIVVSMTMGRWRGRVRAVFDHLPPWSIYRSYQASSFLIGLSSLMSAGIPSYDALRMMHRNGSPWLKDHLEKMMAKMRMGGANQGEALDTGLLDKELSGDVQDYSKLGSFMKAVHTLGSRSLESGVKAIESKMNVVRTLMLFLVAMTVAWIYLTSYLLQGQIADSQSNPAALIGG